MKIAATVAAVSVLALAAGSAAAITVPGTSDPFLAGGASGASLTYNNGYVDTATAQSPVAVNVTGGETLDITAVTGSAPVGNCTNCMLSGPTGDSADYTAVLPFTPSIGFTPFATAYSSPTSPTNELPFNSLVGVYNIAGTTVFEIGDGGIFHVPNGASELYLGTVDSYQWNNNVGAFDVTVTSVPEPAAWALMLVGFGGLGAALRSRRRAIAA